MDTVSKSSKPSSNISDIVHRFAKVCRLKSVGVFSNDQNPNHHLNKISTTTEVSSDDTEETEFDNKKIHPQPIEEETLIIKTHEESTAACGILKLFDTISALKLAYIQLQEAHIPYSPEKIQVADDLIVSELKTLSDIKKSLKQISRPKSSSSLLSRSGPISVKEIHDQESQLEKLQSQIQGKDTEIIKLKKEVEELDMKNLKLDSKIRQKSLEEENTRSCVHYSKPKTFSEAFKAATKSIHDFAKPLISFMKASGWDLDLAVNSIEDSICYLKRSHKKYAFEAYLSRRMFHGFSFKSHNLEDILRFRDPFDALIEYPDSDFAKFCRLKYLLVVHSKMESSFFGNLDQRAFVLSGGHPRTPLYQAFVKMAMCVWVLQAMASSPDSKAEIFGVQRGSEFSEVSMENVVEDEDHTLKPNYESGLNVGFMVMPGFRIGKTVIRSRVYLSKVNSSNGGVHR